MSDWKAKIIAQPGPLLLKKKSLSFENEFTICMKKQYKIFCEI